MTITILLTGGFSVFTKGGWDPATFVSSYLFVTSSNGRDALADSRIRDIPLVIYAYLIWKFVKKTKVVSLSSIALEEAFDRVEQEPEFPELRKTGAIRVVSWIWE